MTKFHFVTPVWGVKHTEIFLELGLPSLLSANNIPNMAHEASITYELFTRLSDREKIEASLAFQKLKEIVEVKYFFIPEEIETSHLMMSDCHRTALQHAYANNAGTVFIPPDCIWADGSMVNLAKIVSRGFAMVHMSDLRVNRDSMMQMLRQSKQPSSPELFLDVRELITVGLRHLHDITKDLFFSEASKKLMPANLLWTVPGQGILARCFHLHPLYIEPNISNTNFKTTIDDDLGLDLDKNGLRQYVVTDSDELFAFELSGIEHRVTANYDKGSILDIAAWAEVSANTRHWQLVKQNIKIHYKDIIAADWDPLIKKADEVINEAFVLTKKSTFTLLKNGHVKNIWHRMLSLDIKITKLIKQKKGFFNSLKRLFGILFYPLVKVIFFIVKLVNRFVDIIKKIKKKKLKWVFEKIKQKYVKAILLKMNFLYFSFLNLIVKKKLLLPDTLCLFYDLENSPITFDLCWMLVLANKNRESLGLKHMHVVFVPGNHQGLREEMTEYDDVINKNSRYFRLYNLLFPLTHLIKACNGFTYCSTRTQAELIRKQMFPNIFPSNYNTYFNIEYDLLAEVINEPSQKIMALAAVPQSLQYINQWIKERASGKKIITITLRYYDYMPERNSNIDAWLEFSKSIDHNEYFIVIIPDTESAMKKPLRGFEQFAHFKEACWNIDLRAALYETSYLNLGVNNGPFALCWLNEKCRYIMFKIVTDEVPQTNSRVLANRGFNLGEKPPFSTPYQSWVWENDTIDVIKYNFQMMCRVIERQGTLDYDELGVRNS